MKRSRLHEFDKGDVIEVRDTGMTGKVLSKGEQQSEVRLDAGWVQCFPNHWLVKRGVAQ